jgi:hypothetical protein
MELGLAILFGPILLLIGYLLPAFQAPPPSVARLTKWLEEHQETGLWSHLLFSLTLTVACCVHAYQRTVPPYDSSVIQDVVTINVISIFLMITAFYRQIKLLPLFCFAFVATALLALAAGYSPLIGGHQADSVLRACIDTSKTLNSPWGNGGVKPYEFPQFYAEALPLPILLIILACLWLFLWLRREKWKYIKTFSQFREPDQILMLIEGLKYGRPSIVLTLRILFVLIFTISVALLVFAVRSIDDILRSRRALAAGWGGKIDDKVWGVGQVLAVFAWTPWLIDMGSSVVKSAKRYFRGERGPPPSASCRIQRRYSV